MNGIYCNTFTVLSQYYMRLLLKLNECISAKCFADENYQAVPTATSALPIFVIPYFRQSVPA